MTDLIITVFLALCAFEAYLVAVLVLDCRDVRHSARERYDDDLPGIA